MFIAVVSYLMGIFMETFIPRRGFLGWLNPVNHLLYPRFPLVSKYALTGTVQQERERLYCYYGKRSSELRSWYRSPRGPAFVLQHQP